MNYQEELDKVEKRISETNENIEQFKNVLKTLHKEKEQILELQESILFRNEAEKFDKISISLSNAIQMSPEIGLRDILESDDDLINIDKITTYNFAIADIANKLHRIADKMENKHECRKHIYIPEKCIRMGS